MPDDERPPDVVRFRREIRSSDGRTYVFQHNLPDAVAHLYAPRDVDEEIPLYRGEFELVDDEDGSSRRFEGEVRLRWRPMPQLFASGITAVTPADFKTLFASPDGIWTTAPRLVVPSGPTVPEPPDSLLDVQAQESRTVATRTQFQPYEHGDPSGLDRITALIPNGWAAYDAAELTDPGVLVTMWPGRTTAQGDGWHVTIDETLASTKGLLKALRDRGGYGVTHLLELRRSDGTTFRASQATPTLEAIRDALGLFLGRRTAPLLPVGWRGATPTWAAWRPAIIDPHRERGSWRDDTIASAQLAGVLAGFLTSWRDPLRRDTLHYATGYYLQALDSNIEVATSIAVSGLLLLAESWLVDELGLHTKTAWHDTKQFNTEAQIRALLNRCKIDPVVPAAFAELAQVQAVLLADSGKARDGLWCLIAMRNHIVHPTRDRRLKWSPYQWAEARMLAAHFLELATLCYVGYTGQYHPRTSAERWVGQVANVPWK